MKAQIEIVNPVTVISEGDKIAPGQAALLDRLKICPFEYKMNVISFLDWSAATKDSPAKLVDAKVLSITNDQILGYFTAGANNLSSISMASGYVISSAMPHMIIKAFKNLAGAAIAADYGFAQLDALKNAAKSGPAPATAAAGGGAKAAEAPKEEEPEEDVDMGDLFGGGDDDY